MFNSEYRKESLGHLNADSTPLEELIDRMDEGLDSDKAKDINEGLPMSIIAESDYNGEKFSSIR